jgi:putative transposase
VVNNYITSNRAEPNLAEREQGLFLSSFQRKLLRNNLEKNLRPEYIRRIKIMLFADLGYSQTEICKTLNCSHETARYWILAAQTGQAHKWKDLSIGRPKTINMEYLDRLRELVNQSPLDCGYGFTRWTAQWLSKHLQKELGIEISERHVNRLLSKMGLSTRSKPQMQEDLNLESSPGNIVINNLAEKSQSRSNSFDLFSTLERII